MFHSDTYIILLIALIVFGLVQFPIFTLTALCIIIVGFAFICLLVALYLLLFGD